MATKKTGRPALPEELIQRARSFRASDHEYTEWSDRTQALGMSLSEIIRLAVPRELQRQERKQCKNRTNSAK